MRGGRHLRRVPRRRLAAAVAAAVLSLAGCASHADHERAGDRRYAEHAYPDAAAEYRLAARVGRPSADLFAKLGAASLHAGDAAGAVDAYSRLAQQDPAAIEEAADGVVLAARLAIDAHDVDALRAAIAELRRLAPLRLPMALAGVAAAGATLAPDARTPEGADILLASVAGARNRTMQDSLLVAWADLLAGTERCPEAAQAYAAVLRRAPATSAMARSAKGGLATCAVEAGRAALSVGALDSAVAAFEQAIAIGTPDSMVRMAWLLTGDARWAASDSSLAAEAYRKAISGGDDSSATVIRARAQLAKLLGATLVP